MALASHSGLRAPSMAALAALDTALSSLRLSTTPRVSAVSRISRRHASHQAQGVANGAKDGAGKRLGAKKTGGEYVVPGNILFKQRGTLWFPGDNCYMGRDHTIHAGQPGYVRYYRDPVRHPDRKYIGIVFEKDQMLPQPVNAPRRRKLGMIAYQMPPPETATDAGDLSVYQAPSTLYQPPSESQGIKGMKTRKGKVKELVPSLRPGYQYRVANWQIGREPERTGTAESVRPFEKGNRWIAWRKRNARIARNAERRALGRGGKKKGGK